MGAPGGQIMSAVTAMSIIQVRAELWVELIARTIVEPLGIVIRWVRGLGCTRKKGRLVRRDSERPSHVPAGRAGGDPRDVSVPSLRLVALTIAANRSKRDSFWVPCPTRAYFSTSRNVRTGITSISPT